MDTTTESHNKRECIGGPLDGEIRSFPYRMLVVASYFVLECDDEPPGVMEEASGRYVRFPRDARPGQARWIAYT